MFAITRSLIPATAAALLLLCACGGSPPTQAAHPSPAADVAQTGRQFSQCVRDHGQPDFPDPTVDGAGHLQWPPDLRKPPASATQPCQSISDRLPNENPGRRSSPDPAMMQRFAQCMRQHGIEDWPDPDSQGKITLPPSLADNLTTGPRSEQIQAAMKGPCKQYTPSKIRSVAEAGAPNSSTRSAA